MGLSPESLKAFFLPLLPGFGLQQAKVVFQLVSQGTKSASQLSTETGISQPNVYHALAFLETHGIVKTASFSPRLYYLPSLPESYARLLAVKTRELQERKKEFEGLLLSPQLLDAHKEFLLRFSPAGQLQVLDLATRKKIRETTLLRALRGTLSGKIAFGKKEVVLARA